jgi:hypothetical protein
MENQLYCDEIGIIAVNGPMVRFDLMVYSATETEGDSPKLVHQQRVVMPLDGFLRGAGRMQAVLTDLERKGVIKRAEKSETPQRQ